MRRTLVPTQMLGKYWPSFRHTKILMCYYNLQLHRIYTAPDQNNRARWKRVVFFNLPEIITNIDIRSCTLHQNSILRIQTEVLYALQYEPLIRTPFWISLAYKRIILKLAKNVSTFLSSTLTKAYTFSYNLPTFLYYFYFFYYLLLFYEVWDIILTWSCKYFLKFLY